MSDVSVVLFYSLDALLRVMRSCFPNRPIWGTDKAGFFMTIQRCKKPTTARIGEEDVVGLRLSQRSDGDTCGLELLPSEIITKSVGIEMTTSLLGGLWQVQPVKYIALFFPWWQDLQGGPLLGNNHSIVMQ